MDEFQIRKVLVHSLPLGIIVSYHIAPWLTLAVIYKANSNT